TGIHGGLSVRLVQRLPAALGAHDQTIPGSLPFRAGTGTPARHRLHDVSTGNPHGHCARAGRRAADNPVAPAPSTRVTRRNQTSPDSRSAEHTTEIQS